MKKIIFCFLLSLPLQTLAQSEGTSTAPTLTPTKNSSQWAVGLSTVQWNEPLNLTQGALTDTDTANFSGLALSLEKEFNYENWGWNIGGLIGAAHGNGGGNTHRINYTDSKENATMFGLTPRIFYILTERVNLGASAFLFMRDVSWAQSGTANAESPNKYQASLLADMTIRLFENWDLYQGIGPLTAGTTLWKVGVNYRF